MKSVGSLLKEARIKKKRSRSEIAKETRIKTSFIEAIENGNWQALPEFTVVNGFVKAIATYVDVDPSRAVAFLRRDYPPTQRELLPKNPKKEFVWGPRLTFLTGVVVIFLVIVGYLGLQYRKFVSPPILSLAIPKEGQVVKPPLLEVTGKTDPDATVSVNNQPVLVTNSGSFTDQLGISRETNEIIVIAKSRSGKETVIRRKIVIEK